MPAPHHGLPSCIEIVSQWPLLCTRLRLLLQAAARLLCHSGCRHSHRLAMSPNRQQLGGSRLS